MKYINTDQLEKIKLTKDNFFVAIDFDRTITAKESCDSWDASGNILGKDFQKQAEALYEKYGPIEQDYTISFEEKNRAMEEWYHKSLELYYEHHLTKEQLEKSIAQSNLIFRQGAKQFLQDMYQSQIPVIILSAGIRNVIEYFLREENCLYDNIYIIGNRLSFDENGNIEDFYGMMIHTLNKTMEGHLSSGFSQKIIDRKYRLLIGDFVEDKNMIPSKEWDQTIFIRFLR